MSDYDPESLASKWTVPLHELLNECQSLWSAGRPRRSWLSLGYPESDMRLDSMTPSRDLKTLMFDGVVTLGHFARAFFPAYIPGRHTHYGSVVYSDDTTAAAQLFDLAWRVNELRRDSGPPPMGTETVARAIRDDRSDFSRIEMPPALGVGPGRYFANICIQRSRLPTAYVHSRLVPLLIRPELSNWCCLLPLRFWSPRLTEIWRSGDPAYAPEPFIQQCRRFSVKP